MARKRTQRQQQDDPITLGKLADRTQGELFRGHMGELVKDPGSGSLVVWMLAWRCKRCGHSWPVRRRRRTHGSGKKYLEAGALTERPSETPKKCPGCDSPLWWKDYVHKLDSPWRRGRVRQPSMLKQVKEKGEETR